MRSRTAKWFECKISFDKVQEDGFEKKVTEAYVVDALSFTEAENRIIEEMAAYIRGDFAVADIKRAPFSEIFFSDEDLADKWYKAKLQYIVLDEKTNKEKRSSVNYLVQASTLNGAVKNIDEVMGGTMIDYVIVSVAETQMMDVFEYELDKNAIEEIDVVKDSMLEFLGCIIAERALKTWKEDFRDESNGEIVSVERNEVILERLSPLTEDNIASLYAAGIRKVKIFKDRRKKVGK